MMGRVVRRYVIESRWLVEIGAEGRMNMVLELCRWGRCL